MRYSPESWTRGRVSLDCLGIRRTGERSSSLSTRGKTAVPLRRGSSPFLTVSHSLFHMLILSLSRSSTLLSLSPFLTSSLSLYSLCYVECKRKTGYTLRLGIFACFFFCSLDTRNKPFLSFCSVFFTFFFLLQFFPFPFLFSFFLDSRHSALVSSRATTDLCGHREKLCLCKAKLCKEKFFSWMEDTVVSSARISIFLRIERIPIYRVRRVLHLRMDDLYVDR